MPCPVPSTDLGSAPDPEASRRLPSAARKGTAAKQAVLLLELATALLTKCHAAVELQLRLPTAVEAAPLPINCPANLLSCPSMFTEGSCDRLQR
jgi:hypothetical protein